MSCLVLKGDQVESRSDFILALGVFQISQSEICFGIGRHIRPGQLQLLFRDRDIAGFKSLPAGIVSIQRPERRITLRPRNEDGGGNEQKEINWQATVISRN